ncbi:Leukocyte elastase inhibitor [Liparis tanakae]|uniref:Leukocyte elastase inhibitor n=1 Tax=Liparis tanakae TaxID=230148 RepID=A0A4Z2G839_9TELE|nr:Leukocyte elastase inhibitor [Liparis tanakae]
MTTVFAYQDVTDTMETSTSPKTTKTSKANTTFSLALFKKFGDDDKTANVFYSPFSISSALAMVMLGARGNTATQMSEVLCFTEQPKQADAEEMQTQSQMHSQMQTRMQLRTQIQRTSRLPDYLVKCLKPQHGEDDVHASFSQLLSELNKENAPYALSLANRLYGEQSFQFVEDFLSETKEHYNAELESVDFKTSAAEATVNINSWVEKQTQGKIQELLLPGVVDESTLLVLVNAIYFKSNWSKKFEEDSTVDAQFRINKYDEAKAELTELKEKCERAEHEKQSLADKFEECRATMEELKEKGTKASTLLPVQAAVVGLVLAALYWCFGAFW